MLDLVPTLARACGLSLCLAMAACSPAGVGPASASAAARGLPPAPPPAPDGLPMPDLTVAWSPPVISAGDVSALAEALGRHQQVELRLGPGLDDETERARAHRVLAALSPETELASGGGESRLPSLIPGGLPLARIAESPEENRPRYDPGSVVVDVARWSSARAEAQGKAGSNFVLAVDDALVDVEAWRKQPASAVGSCNPALAALGAGQEQSLAVLEPFLDHADELLWVLYRNELGRELPKLGEKLSVYSTAKTRKDFADDEQWETYRCGAAYLDYVRQHAACTGAEQACPFAPRMFLVGGARIGAAEPEGYLDAECAQRVGTDYVTEMRSISRSAVRSVGEMLDAKWSGLAERVGALSEVSAAMEDVCTPRRRRFAEVTTAEARSRLDRIGDLFREPNPMRDGMRWLLDDGEFYVPGIGSVHQLSRFDGGPSGISDELVREARALREFVLRGSRCGGSAGSLPLAAVLVNLEGASVDFLGYFYEEELFCDGLPALVARQ